MINIKVNGTNISIENSNTLAYEDINYVEDIESLSQLRTESEIYYINSSMNYIQRSIEGFGESVVNFLKTIKDRIVKFFKWIFSGIQKVIQIIIRFINKLRGKDKIVEEITDVKYSKNVPVSKTVTNNNQSQRIQKNKEESYTEGFELTCRLHDNNHQYKAYITREELNSFGFDSSNRSIIKYNKPDMLNSDLTKFMGKVNDLYNEIDSKNEEDLFKLLHDIRDYFYITNINIDNPKFIEKFKNFAKNITSIQTLSVIQQAGQSFANSCEQLQRSITKRINDMDSEFQKVQNETDQKEIKSKITHFQNKCNVLIKATSMILSYISNYSKIIMNINNIVERENNEYSDDYDYEYIADNIHFDRYKYAYGIAIHNFKVKRSVIGDQKYNQLLHCTDVLFSLYDKSNQSINNNVFIIDKTNNYRVVDFFKTLINCSPKMQAIVGRNKNFLSNDASFAMYNFGATKDNNEITIQGTILLDARKKIKVNKLYHCSGKANLNAITPMSGNFQQNIFTIGRSTGRVYCGQFPVFRSGAPVTPNIVARSFVSYAKKKYKDSGLSKDQIYNKILEDIGLDKMTTQEIINLVGRDESRDDGWFCYEISNPQSYICYADPEHNNFTQKISDKLHGINIKDNAVYIESSADVPVVQVSFDNFINKNEILYALKKGINNF